MAKPRQQMLSSMVMMGVNRSTDPVAAEIVTPGVYVQELPSGVDPIPAQ